SVTLNSQGLKNKYSELNGYNLTFEQIDLGYTINGGNITLLRTQNAGITYVKIIAKNSVDTKVYYMPINRSVGYGITLKYVVKDNISLYNLLYNYSASTNQIQAIKDVLSITSNVSVSKMAFTNDYLLFNVRIVSSDSDMNLVSSYYLLEVRNTVYSYYKNYKINFTGVQDYKLLLSSVISDSDLGERVLSIDCDSKYLTCLTITNDMITIKPIFKDIVVPLTIKTEKSGLYRYYYVNLTIKAVTKARAMQELDITTVDRIVRGNSYTLTEASYDGFDFEWQLVSGTDVSFSDNTIVTTASTGLQTICVCLYVRATFGEYVFTHYIDIIDNSFEALYSQQVFTSYSGINVDLLKIGKWNLKVNGEIVDISNFDVTYTFTKLAGNSGFVINGNMLTTYFSIDDNVIKIKCQVAIVGYGTFEAIAYLTIQSGIEFISGVYEVTQNATFPLISTSVVNADLINGLNYSMVSSSVSDGSVVLTETGKMQITYLASEGYKDFKVKVADGVG
ncbi:MAG: hypothetical protein ACI4TX_04360, partial [Christensenellales bacterium]